MENRREKPSLLRPKDEQEERRYCGRLFSAMEKIWGKISPDNMTNKDCFLVQRSLAKIGIELTQKYEGQHCYHRVQNNPEFGGLVYEGPMYYPMMHTYERVNCIKAFVDFFKKNAMALKTEPTGKLQQLAAAFKLEDERMQDRDKSSYDLILN
jgi:hypothetical protein